MFLLGSAYPTAKLGINASMPPILFGAMRMGIVFICLIPFCKIHIPNKKYLYNETTGVVSSDKNIESYKTNLSIQYIDDFLSGGYTQFSIDQNFGTLDLSGSASDLSTDQSSTGAKTNGNYAKTFVEYFFLKEFKVDL